MPSAIVPWFRAHRRGLRRAAIALAVVYALYLGAANVFLNSALGEQTVNRKPDRYHARWDWAMSLYPGHLHARGVAMGGHARSTAWTAASPRAAGRIKLLPLLRREVAFGTIRAHLVSVHVARAGRDMPSTKRRDRAPWTLRFDAIATPSLLRLDFYEARVTGRGDARFVFEKRLQGGAMEVGRSTLRMPGASLRLGATEIMRGGDLDFEIAIPAHLREQAQGQEKLVLTDARLRVDGPAPGLDLAARDGDALPIGASAVSGHVRADLALERGVLIPDSRIDWSAPVFSLDRSGAPQRHPMGVALRTAPEAIQVAARISAPEAGEPWLRADLQVKDRRLGPDDWLRPLRALEGEVRTQWSSLPLRWIDVILDDLDWIAFDGRADLDAAVVVQRGRLQPGTRIDLQDARLAARVLDNRFAGRAHARLRMREGLEDDAGARTTIAIRMDRFTLAPEAAPERIELQGRDLRLDLASSGELAAFHERMDARLRFDDAQVPDLRSYNRYLPGDSVRLLGGRGQASADVRLDDAGDMISGRLAVRGQDVRAMIGPSSLSGDIDVRSRLSRMERSGDHYRIDALEATLDGVRLDEARSAETPWWARFELEEGRLEWREPFAVSGRGRVAMRDVSVLLGLFAEHNVFPRWIGSLIDSGEAHAEGDLRMGGDELVFDRIRARNDRIDLLARLRIVDGLARGDLYARWGVLALGVELDDGERTLHLAGARDWYDSRPSFLPD